MDATYLAQAEGNVWYLDTSCRNHMIGNKNWFIELDESVRVSIKFDDNSIVTS